MAKADLINDINALGMKGVNVAQDTKNTVAELELILKGAQASENEELIEELNAENDRLTKEIERLKGAKGPVLPRVTVDDQEYEFRLPKFRLPKSEVTTAQAVVDREDEEELAECIKRGVLVPLEKEV